MFFGYNKSENDKNQIEERKKRIKKRQKINNITLLW